MAWVRLDDQFPDHPKVIGLSNEAFRLYVGSIAYCARFYPATEIPREYVFAKLNLKMQGGRWARYVTELVDAGLWTCSNHDEYFTQKWQLVTQDFFVYEFGRNYEYLAHREKVFARDSYTCVSCGATDDLTLDHIVPISKGGGNSISNLQTLCRSCNSRKGARLE